MMTTVSKRTINTFLVKCLLCLIGAAFIAWIAGAIDGSDSAWAKERLSGKYNKSTNTRTIKMIADQWYFKPSTLRVKAGEKVILIIDVRASEIPNVDSHGFSIPHFNWRQDLKTFQINKIELPPEITEKPGKYFFECDIFCGPGHPDMNGYLIVVE